MQRMLSVLALGAVLAGGAVAHDETVGGLTLSDLWARATPPAATTGGGYLTIRNDGPEADRLVGAESPHAEAVALHEMSVREGIMTMRPLDAIDIAPGAKVALEPGGRHIMFTGLRGPFVEGGRVPVTLTFENAGRVETFLHVLGIGARGADHGSHQ